MIWRRGVLFVVLWLLAGCAMLRGGAPEGRLRVQMTDVVINGTAARLQGSVLSEYTEPVEGVRYVILVRNPDDTNVVYERFERQTDTVIPAGGRADMGLDIEGESLNQPKFRIVITATPVKVGGRDIPAPPPAPAAPTPAS